MSKLQSNSVIVELGSKDAFLSISVSLIISVATLVCSIIIYFTANLTNQLKVRFIPYIECTMLFSTEQVVHQYIQFLLIKFQHKVVMVTMYRLHSSILVHYCMVHMVFQNS